MKEKKYVDDQIVNLKMTSIANFTIKHKLILSMVDGKVCNSLTNNIVSEMFYLRSSPNKYE